MPFSAPISRSVHALLLGTAVWLASPALAQKTVESRVDRLEKEMQAVQRKVFPGVSGPIVAPDLLPDAAPPPQIGSPATAPIADLTARVNAIETQLARLTGQVEEQGHRLQVLEEGFAAYKAQQAEAAAALAPQQAAPQPEAPALPAPSSTRPTPAGVVPVKAPPPAKTPSAAAARNEAAKADAAAAARTKAVAAIEKPSSGNAAQDGYTYGFRLWTGKFYPEAEAQLQEVIDTFPNNPIASRTANLLGRTYLDDGKPSIAAKILFENYRLRPKGDRAAESLALVGESLIQLKRNKDACLAYDELSDTFGTTMPASVRDMMTKGRVRAKCGE